MSRVSLSRRLQRIKDHFLRPGSLEYALENLPAEMRALYQLWRQKADELNSRFENHQISAFAAFLEYPTILPRMPSTLQYAMFPYLKRVDAEIRAAMRSDMPIDEATNRMAAAYQHMLQGHEQ